MTQNHMTILKLHAERCIGKIFYNLTLHLDNVIFRHFYQPS